MRVRPSRRRTPAAYGSEYAPSRSTDEPRVTVVLATRNRRAELTRTLGKLEELRPRPPVIVVDNASSDGTPAALRRSFPAVQLVELPGNRGAAARNTGVARARTPYVAFCDDDSWWAHDALPTAADTLDTHPVLGAVVARTLVGPDERPDPVNAAMATSPLPGGNGGPGPRVLGCLACSLVVRREAFLAAGGFSPLLFFVGEERLLAYDLTAAGWPLAYVADVTAHHHPSASRVGKEARAVLERRNAVLTAWMRRPLPVAVDATRKLAGDAARRPAARGALRAALVRMPAALRRRRLLPPELERDVRRLETSTTSADAAAVAGAAVPGRVSGARRPRARHGAHHDHGTRLPHGAQVRHQAGPPPGAAPGEGASVSVVIMTRNRRGDLMRTLEHMSALPERPPLVVVDNGSTDGTGAAVAEDYPEVTLLRSEDNLGAVARNAAAAYLRSPYIAFCDDDTWWEPGALARAAAALDAHPRLGCVVGRILVEPDQAEDPITPELRHSPVPGPSWLPGPALLGILAGASVLRLSAFREVGGFSPRLWLGGEEELLTMDLAARGWWACWMEEVTVHHAASAVRDPRGRRRLGIRNALWTTWLRRPAGSAARRTAALLRSVPPDRLSAAAVIEATAGLPWVLREREVVPPHVEYGLLLLEEPQRRSPARRYVDG